MSKIELEVKDCQDCPYCKSEYIYTSDSFDDMYDYFCTKKDGKKVGAAVEYRREMPPIPDWCPISADRYIRRFAEKVGSLIAGHSNYHGDSILSALYCLAEGKEVNKIEPLE